MVFLLGLTAAAYSSADSALTALTTSFCVDFLGMNQTKAGNKDAIRTRWIVHISISIVLCLVVLLFNALNNDAVINNLFIAAGYTYGPLLGLFSFGMFTKREVIDKYVIPVCIASPVLAYLLNHFRHELLGGFEFGFLILAVNGLLTFIGLYLISKSGKTQ